ncbi:MAG: alkaline phosphatase [Deltaproteobacteria bacterium]|nr:alkaline phosphatase [Deltaproteobacteria bacterium]
MPGSLGVATLTEFVVVEVDLFGVDMQLPALFRSLVVALVLPLSAFAADPQNIIVVVGDGMGVQALGLHQLYAERVAKQSTQIERMEESGTLGLVAVHAPTTLVNDSACSATQLASGAGCSPETLGLDLDGNSIQNVAEQAAQCGKRIGLVTDTRVTHATPAAFYSHRIDRDSENHIADDLLSSKVDVILGGGLRHFIDRDGEWDGVPSKSRRTDRRDLLAAAKAAGFRTVHTRQALANESAEKVIGLFADNGLADGVAIANKRAAKREPSLPELTQAALRLLPRGERGMFLMVEAGQIDWAEHANDAGWLIQEMIKFDATLKEVLDFQDRHPHTLVIVTADHSTGGFGLSYSAFDVPPPTTLPSGALFAPDFNFGRASTIRKLLTQERTLTQIVREFADLPLTERKPESLQSLVERYTAFSLSRESAARVLDVRPNRFYREGHADFGFKEGPRCDDLDAFYPELPKYGPGPLIAKALSEQQGVVWATGTHTSEPVPIFARGPGQERFRGMMHMREVGNVVKGLVADHCSNR